MQVESARPDTRSPRGTAVSGRAAATIPRVGRVTITGRIMATAIPSAGSPAWDLAPVASITSAGSPAWDLAPVASIASPGSPVGRLFTVQLGSAVSARGSDIWAASAEDNWTIGTIDGAVKTKNRFVGDWSKPAASPGAVVVISASFPVSFRVSQNVRISAGFEAPARLVIPRCTRTYQEVCGQFRGQLCRQMFQQRSRFSRRAVVRSRRSCELGALPYRTRVAACRGRPERIGATGNHSLHRSGRAP